MPTTVYRYFNFKMNLILSYVIIILSKYSTLIYLPSIGPRCKDCITLKCGPNGACYLQDSEPKCNCSNGYTGKNCEVSKCVGFCKGNVSEPFKIVIGIFKTFMLSNLMFVVFRAHAG